MHVSENLDKAATMNHQSYTPSFWGGEPNVLLTCLFRSFFFRESDTAFHLNIFLFN